MPLPTDTLTTHIIVILSWWETYRQRLLFLLDTNQMDFTARCWVHFSIWIRFSLYAVHVVLINQYSHHTTILFLYCTLIVTILGFYTKMQTHSSQTQHQLCSLTACLLFNINNTATNLQPSTSQFCIQTPYPIRKIVCVSIQYKNIWNSIAKTMLV